MAIEGDAVIAVGQGASGSEAVCLTNSSAAFEERPHAIELAHILSDTSVFKLHHWTNYFLAAIQGLVKHYKEEVADAIDIQEALIELIRKNGTIQLVIDGTVPIGSGLSRYYSLQGPGFTY